LRIGGDAAVQPHVVHSKPRLLKISKRATFSVPGEANFQHPMIGQFGTTETAPETRLQISKVPHLPVDI